MKIFVVSHWTGAYDDYEIQVVGAYSTRPRAEEEAAKLCGKTAHIEHHANPKRLTTDNRTVTRFIDRVGHNGAVVDIFKVDD